MNEKKGKPSYLISVFTNKCPRCREGNLFVTNNAYAFRHNNYMKMHANCLVCKQPTELEVGFYYGTSYVSYALTVAFSGFTFLLWWLLIGFSVSLDDNRILWWLGINSFIMIVLQPMFMRLSRTLWLSWFVKYDDDWENHPLKEPERIVKKEMGNW